MGRGAPEQGTRVDVDLVRGLSPCEKKDESVSPVSFVVCLKWTEGTENNGGRRDREILG